MFSRLIDNDAPVIQFEFEGRTVEAPAGDSIAAALLAAGHLVLRQTPVSQAPRGPYCMMGACFECLVEVDDRPNVQACMTPVRAGMTVSSMRGARELRVDGDDT
jgi:predicted molibdopterin-dependent oxidoreductase YjgC